jgi:hypothetical protein
MVILSVGTGSNTEPLKSGVAVAHLLFTERAVNTAGNCVTDPDDGSQQDDGEGELKGIYHESFLRDFPLATGR